MNKTHFLALCALLSAAAVAEAKVKPSAMIGDNMVLQQNSNVRLWGTADPGETFKITTSWDGRTYDVSADRCGDWSMAVVTPQGSFTPQTVTISGGETITIDNVLIGEVWLASGQSNMQMPLKGFPGCCVKDGYKEDSRSEGLGRQGEIFSTCLSPRAIHRSIR